MEWRKELFHFKKKGLYVCDFILKSMYSFSINKFDNYFYVPIFLHPSKHVSRITNIAIMNLIKMMQCLVSL